MGSKGSNKKVKSKFSFCESTAIKTIHTRVFTILATRNIFVHWWDTMVFGEKYLQIPFLYFSLQWPHLGKGYNKVNQESNAPKLQIPWQKCAVLRTMWATLCQPFPFLWFRTFSLWNWWSSCLISGLMSCCACLFFLTVFSQCPSENSWHISSSSIWGPAFWKGRGEGKEGTDSCLAL